jgi:hypothetical protein
MAQKDRRFARATQVFWAFKALIEGRAISTKSKIREAEDRHLAAIVELLKSKYYLPIVAEYREPANTAYYRQPAGTDPAAPIYPPSAKSLADEKAK